MHGRRSSDPSPVFLLRLCGLAPLRKICRVLIHFVHRLIQSWLNRIPATKYISDQYQSLRRPRPGNGGGLQ